MTTRRPRNSSQLSLFELRDVPDPEPKRPGERPHTQRPISDKYIKTEEVVQATQHFEGGVDLQLYADGVESLLNEMLAHKMHDTPLLLALQDFGSDLSVRIRFSSAEPQTEAFQLSVDARWRSLLSVYRYIAGKRISASTK